MIAWAAKTFPCCVFVTYEQILPLDAFGKVMCANLAQRGSPLLGVHAFPDVPAQRYVPHLFFSSRPLPFLCFLSPFFALSSFLLFSHSALCALFRSLHFFFRQRYLGFGFESCLCSDMNEYWASHLPRTEAQRAAALEVFDEEEEWRIKAAHYFLVVAGTLPYTHHICLHYCLPVTCLVSITITSWYAAVCFSFLCFVTPVFGCYVRDNITNQKKTFSFFFACTQ